MKNRNLWLIGFILTGFTTKLIAQTNNLTGSPYSLFGLGVQTNSNIGRNSALGRGGYALEGDLYINNYNPAAYAVHPEKNFMFDIGILAELSTVVNNEKDERRLAGNIASMAMATSINEKSGLGLTLDTYTDVGYALIGVQSNIEGSFATFNSNIFGSGGLNDLKLSYGYKLSEYLNVGIGVSHLFGSINEVERINAGTSSLTVDEKNRYSGFRFDIGAQGKFTDNFKIGVRWRLPTSLSALRDRKVIKTIDFIIKPTTVENVNDVDIPNFDLPFEFSAGVAFNLSSGLVMNLDYSHNYWNDTGQSDNIGSFIDQDIMAIGLEYMKNPRGFKYWERISFRTGFNYDTGYLSINDEPINSYSITGGLGIPLGRASLSKINLSFTHSKSGSSNGILIEETFNTININFSLRDIWFLKRKID